MKIDEIINNKRDQLDVEDTPKDLWENIRNDWKTEPKKRSLDAWKIAATFLLITSFGLLFYSQSLRQEIEQLASLGDISAEYLSVEVQYKSEIETLESSIPLAQINEKNDFSWLLDELETLEKVNKKYRSDIGTIGNEEQLVKVLLDYYEKKIKLLKKLQLEMNRNEKAIKASERKVQNT
ncbi:MAG: hypothetical protein AB8B73_10180 [Ekhidna sp.]